MRIALLGLALLGAATATTAAQAQVIIQAPPPPGVIVGRPPPPPAYAPDYWRRGERDDWRRRAEFRDAEHRRWEWRRSHCVRDHHGGEYCRP